MARIETGTLLYLVYDTSMDDPTPKLHTITVVRGGEKRIKIASSWVTGYHLEFTVGDDGLLYPLKLSRTPEAAFRRFIALRERSLDLARGTIKRSTLDLEIVRDLILENHPGMGAVLREIKSVTVLDDSESETIYRCKECGVDCASACSLHPRAGVNVYKPGDKAAGSRW